MKVDDGKLKLERLTYIDTSVNECDNARADGSDSDPSVDNNHSAALLKSFFGKKAASSSISSQGALMNMLHKANLQKKVGVDDMNRRYQQKLIKKLHGTQLRHRRKEPSPVVAAPKPVPMLPKKRPSTASNAYRPRSPSIMSRASIHRMSAEGIGMGALKTVDLTFLSMHENHRRRFYQLQSRQLERQQQGYDSGSGQVCYESGCANAALSNSRRYHCQANSSEGKYNSARNAFHSHPGEVTAAAAGKTVVVRAMHNMAVIASNTEELQLRASIAVPAANPAEKAVYACSHLEHVGNDDSNNNSSGANSGSGLALSASCGSSGSGSGKYANTPRSAGLFSNARGSSASMLNRPYTPNKPAVPTTAASAGSLEHYPVPLVSPLKKKSRIVFNLGFSSTVGSSSGNGKAGGAGAGMPDLLPLLPMGGPSSSSSSNSVGILPTTRLVTSLEGNMVDMGAVEAGAGTRHIGNTHVSNSSLPSFWGKKVV